VKEAEEMVLEFGTRLASRLTQGAVGTVFAGGLLAFGALMAVVLNASPLVAIALYGGIALCLFIWKWPYLGLLLLLFIIPLQFLAKITEDGSVTLAKVIMPLVFAVWLLRYLIRRDKQLIEAFIRHPILITGGLYLLSVLPSFVNAKEPGCAFGFWFLKLIPCFILVVMIVDMVRTPRRLLWLYQTVFVISFLVAAFGIYEFLTGQSILNAFGMEYYLISGSSNVGLVTTKTSVGLSGVEKAEWYRVASTFLDPDYFAGYLLLSLGFALGLWHLTKSRFWRVSVFLYIPVAITDIVATGSRSCFIALIFFCGLLVLLFRFPLRKTLLVCIVLILLISIPFIDEILPQYRKGISLEAFYQDPRYGFWTTALNMIRDKPIVGVGLGNFVTDYNVYKSASAPNKPFMAHNVFLGVFAETGIIGLFFFSIFGASILLTLIYTVLVSQDKTTQYLSKLILIAFCSFSLFALTSNTLDFEYVWVTIAMVIVFSIMDHGFLEKEADEV
jgi:hypothetical protein